MKFDSEREFFVLKMVTTIKSSLKIIVGHYTYLIVAKSVIYGCIRLITCMCCYNNML